jgi:hypothetical protein
VGPAQSQPLMRGHQEHETQFAQVQKAPPQWQDWQREQELYRLLKEQTEMIERMKDQIRELQAQAPGHGPYTPGYQDMRTQGSTLQAPGGQSRQPPTTGQHELGAVCQGVASGQSHSGPASQQLAFGLPPVGLSVKASPPGSQTVVQLGSSWPSGCPPSACQSRRRLRAVLQPRQTAVLLRPQWAGQKRCRLRAGPGTWAQPFHNRHEDPGFHTPGPWRAIQAAADHRPT